MAAHLKTMEKDLQDCSVCKKRTLKMYVLKCHHETCQSCFRNWKLQNPHSNKFLCPLCRTFTFFLTHEGVHDGVLQEVPPCDVCAGSSKGITPVYATSFCRNCQDCMCHKCAEIHLRFPSFIQHTVDSIQELNDNNEFCQKHKYRSNELYCEKCGILLCSLCATREHQHHLESVQDAADFCKGYAKEVEIVAEKVDDIYDFRYNVRYQEQLHRINEFGKSITEMKTKVKDHVNSIIEDLFLQESELLASLDEDTDRMKRWQNWWIGTEALKPDAEKLFINCKTYSKTKKPVDLLVGIKNIYPKVEHGLSQYGGVDFAPLETSVDFIPEQHAHISIGRVIPKKGDVYIKSENFSYCDCDPDDGSP